MPCPCSSHTLSQRCRCVTGPRGGIGQPQGSSVAPFTWLPLSLVAELSLRLVPPGPSLFMCEMQAWFSFVLLW